MGFVKDCVDTLLRFAALNPFAALSPLDPQQGFHQRPLLGSPGYFTPEPKDTIKFTPDGASPGFQCEYHKRWKPCNSATSRDCWLQDTHSKDGFGAYSQIDIHTDYENVEDTPKGVTREYWLDVNGDVLLTADGFHKNSGMVFNKQFPGPLIEACWGDELKIHVQNHYDANGTTIHWHGIRQLGTMQMDGVNGVTQCPIAKGDSFTYTFQALQYGSTWYHSHYSLQYPDGLVGPMVIHGPSSANWDIDLGPVLMQDYVHNSSFVQYLTEEVNPNSPTTFARADTIVVNGVGHDPYTGTGSYFKTKFTKGKKHLLRLINGSAGTNFVFSIDKHNFTVIESDLVPIEPYNTSSLHLSIGQRYMIVVDADQEPGNYWMRTHPQSGCNGFNINQTCGGVFTDTCSPQNITVTTGIISYDESNKTLPSDQPWNFDKTCRDEPVESLRPVVPWVIDRHPQNEITDSRFAAALSTVNSSPDTGAYHHWMLTPDFLWLDFERPTILNFQNESFDRNSNFHIVDDKFDSGYIFMIIEASPNTTIPHPDSTVIPISHPLHWHGMDVVILAQSTETFDPVSSYNSFNFDNPPRRDVALLPGGGYVAIAFKPDNPGAWLMHCHIAWHASAGLGLQILEREKDIVSSLGGDDALKETRRVCRNWERYNQGHPVKQDDSGI